MSSLKQILKAINRHPLAKRHPLKAYFNFFSWQLSQAVYPHEKIKPFVNGTELVIKKGMAGATGNIYTGLHDFNDMGFLLHFLEPGDLFFDIGANVGTYSVLAAGCKKSKVCAFEPVNATFLWLQKNMRINGIEHLVQAYNMGMGSKKGVLQFTTSHDTVNHVSYQNSPATNANVTNVNVETLDNIALKEGTPVLVKIDVEGFESEVIEGMKHSLLSTNLKAIIIELNGCGRRYGYSDENIHNTLVKHGFSSYEYDPFCRVLKRISTYGAINTIYIRDLEFAKARIARADKITIFSESF